MADKRLRGQLDPKRFTVSSVSGEKHSSSSAICPIIVQDKETRVMRSVGTGFFVGTIGLIMTAKHVMEEALSEGVANSAIGVFHFMGQNEYMLRSIIHGYGFENSDVYVALLDVRKHNKTGEQLYNPVLPVSFGECNAGDSIYSCSYPLSEVKSDGSKHVFRYEPKYFEGNLIQEFPNGRDSAMLPNPCWQTDMDIHGGSSGGPVFNSQGQVIGINSSSFSHDTSCSFISTLEHILDLETNINIADRAGSNYTIRELVDMGIISSA